MRGAYVLLMLFARCGAGGWIKERYHPPRAALELDYAAARRRGDTQRPVFIATPPMPHSAPDTRLRCGQTFLTFTDTLEI